jgi:superfamily I DNA/RNA helicase
MISVNEWQPSDGLKLEPNALRAVRELTRNVALTAGPGAGKTELLAQRADFLLRTNNAAYPRRILAISFKTDASRNLKDRVRRRCGPLSSRFDSHSFNAFAKRLIDRFGVVLKGQNALNSDYAIGPQRIMRTHITFGDQVPLAIEILENSQVALNAVRQTYSHVFLDEFQDCTSQQFKLIQVAFGSTDVLITAVGDTKQKIMGWAGALDGILAMFASHFKAVPLNLYQNFRSLPLLRRMQNDMVKVMEPSAAIDDSDLEGVGGEIEEFEFEDSPAEALGIASLVHDWINSENIPASEIAVLVSKQIADYCEHLMEEFGKLNVPYRNEQHLQDISAEPVARVIVDYLLTLCSERQPVAYERLMEFLCSNDDEEDHARWQHLIDERRAQCLSSALDMPIIRELVEELLEKVGPEQLTSLSADYQQGNYLECKIPEILQRIEQLWSESGDLDRALGRFSETLRWRAQEQARMTFVLAKLGVEFRR